MMRGLGYQSHHFAPGTSGATLNFNFLNDGLDPRITFTRTSNATQFNSAGTLVYAPHNLILDSEDWSTASWNRLNCTFSYNAATAPNGTLTADCLIPNNGSTIGRTTQFVSTLPDLVSCVLSVYVKTSGLTNVIIQVVDKSNTTQSSQTLNLATGTLSGSIDAGTTSTATDTGDGWYRFNFAITSISSGATTPVWTIRCSSTGNGTDGILLWGAQLNVGSLQSYNQTTSTAYYGPRLDYNPATLAAQGLLIEEARTNLLTYSEDLSNAVWTLTGQLAFGSGSILNDGVAPDGATTADKVVEDTSTGTHLIGYGTVTTSTTATSSVSFFIKSAGRTALSIRYGSQALANRMQADINLNTGAVTGVTNTGTATGATCTATLLPNQWWRITASVNPNDAASTQMRLVIYPNGVASYTGDGTSGVYVWGAQLEAGAFPTSYIPTTTTALTRSADVASVNTLSPWFNATEGTLFAESSVNYTVPGTSFPLAASLNDNSSNNRIEVGYVTSAVASFEVSTGGTPQVGLYPANVSQIRKTAGAYATNDFAVSTNGSAASVDTSGSVPTITRLALGTRTTGGTVIHLRRVTYYPRRLSNAELQAITA